MKEAGMEDEIWVPHRTRHDEQIRCHVVENDWFGSVTVRCRVPHVSPEHTTSLLQCRLPEKFLHKRDRCAVRFKLRGHEWCVYARHGHSMTDDGRAVLGKSRMKVRGVVFCASTVALVSRITRLRCDGHIPLSITAVRTTISSPVEHRWMHI